MDAAPSPAPASQTPSPTQTDLLAAWPRSAQLAAAFLLGSFATLLVIHCWTSSRWAARPTDLERGPGLTYRVDLNRSDRAELLQIPGVGPGLAARIEDYRRTNGPFRRVEDLDRVPGIGAATLERMRSWVCVQETERLAETTNPNPTTRFAYYPAVPDEPAEPARPIRPGGGKKADALTEPIDVNRASAEELQRLPGIGPKLSQRIVEEREKGPFLSVDDLSRVHGIGPKTVERLRPYVTVDGTSRRKIVREEL